jgi:hypothetical protein
MELTPAPFFDGPAPEQAEFFDREAKGWELLLPEEDQREKFKFDGSRLARNKERYTGIVQALKLGLPAATIAKAFNVSRNTVAQVVLRENISIEQLKKSNASLMLKTAGLCVESFLQDLIEGNVDAKTKAIAAGIFSQNGLLYAGEATSIVQVAPEKEISLERLNAYIDALPSASVVEASSAPPGMDLEGKEPGEGADGPGAEFGSGGGGQNAQ